MNYLEFCNNAQKKMVEYIGNRGSVSITPMRKNNGIIMDALIIKEKDVKVSPTIYLEPYYKLYKSGEPFGDVIETLTNSYIEHSNQHIDVDCFYDFDKIKENIAFKLIHYESNKQLLDDVPYKRWNDLALVYIYVLKESDIGSATILIHNNHLQIWNTTEEELYKCATNNTPLIMPEELKTMNQILGESLGKQIFDEEEQWELSEAMYVLSNKSRIFGATALLYSQKLKELSVKHDCGLYILPSSIHEVILMPTDKCSDTMFMRQMVIEVNANEVDAQERLSDNVYYYDPTSGDISIVAV